jgi:hypothetical protein
MNYQFLKVWLLVIGFCGYTLRKTDYDIVETTNFYLHYFEINDTFDTGTE